MQLHAIMCHWPRKSHVNVNSIGNLTTYQLFGRGNDVPDTSHFQHFF